MGIYVQYFTDIFTVSGFLQLLLFVGNSFLQCNFYPYSKKTDTGPVQYARKNTVNVSTVRFFTVLVTTQKTGTGTAQIKVHCTVHFYCTVFCCTVYFT